MVGCQIDILLFCVIMLNSMYTDINACGDDFAVRMYAADITGSDPDVWYDDLPQERREKTDKLKREEDRKRSVMAYVLLEHAITDLARDDGMRYGSFAKEGLPPIFVDANGKPYFQGNPVFFNISHSGDRVIVALAPCEVGCDVEQKSSNAMKVAKRFFGEEEYNVLLAAEDENERDKLFRDMWTLKESVLKCCGEGLRRPLRDFSLTDEDGNIKESVTLGDGPDYHVRSYRTSDGYSYSVCSIYDKIEDEIRWVSI